MKVYVFVGMCGGIIDKVEVFAAEPDAISAWEKYTDVNWDEWCETDKSVYDELLGDDYDGTTICESEMVLPDVGFLKRKVLVTVL